jgi:hypothetical protein
MEKDQYSGPRLGGYFSRSHFGLHSATKDDSGILARTRPQCTAARKSAVGRVAGGAKMGEALIALRALRMSRKCTLMCFGVKA